MKSFEFLSIKREKKPRTSGLTMVLDKGLGLETASSLMDISGEYVDYLKFGWGTSIVHEQDIIKSKVEMYKSHNITPYTGGTLFELAYTKDKLEEFFDEAHNLGFPAIEVSDGSTDIPHENKLECIEKAKESGFEVLSEIGKKNPILDKELSIDERISNMADELNAGSSLIIVEAREGGKNIGIFDSKGNAKEDEIDTILNSIKGEKILWEAPNKNQQVFFILKLGNTVNLGNISSDEITSLETLRRGLRGDTFGKL
ncbi:phosphosulfolactate synthase [Methanobrevibacter gottschalkii]|uniref:Phosphosulfolactate synthase n=2 Tax=Methanobrevibacter gottschalkii TaxID=190974 RepID=A0A3N5C6C2_9EURY|nr:MULTISPECIES: phosphosulfolactate synthase [Methanobrevibacter]MCQ2970236.1 phosphosulfolactate synthase [archaeon]OEC98712.1 phosphosulfolactate synthase [Methanobrevibacter sp. A27]RPF51951.1 phosphosulfolactate synthase [Methanobrevibacter gottschalkii DSM 11977]SEL40756.1 phosphosulfolactate synthase [Methanobrevibacter gottschalkii]